MTRKQYQKVALASTRLRIGGFVMLMDIEMEISEGLFLII